MDLFYTILVFGFIGVCLAFIIEWALHGEDDNEID